MLEFFHLKRMIWVEQALAASGAVRELLWGWSCPLHCGSSALPFFIAGLSLGICLGIALSIGFCYHFLGFISLARHPSADPVPFASHPSSSAVNLDLEVRRRSRLSGYLRTVNEQRPQGAS